LLLIKKLIPNEN